MTEHLPRLSIGEHDKHAPVRGQPLNAVNPPPVAAERPFDTEMAPWKPCRNATQYHLKRQQSLLSLDRPPPALTPTTALVLHQDEGTVI
jgi:hypothetical protein